jgi:hypothetical protein
MRSSRVLAALLPGLCAGAALMHASCSRRVATAPAPIADAGPPLPTYTIQPYDGAVPPSVTRVPVHAEMVNGQVDVRTLMFAAGEMQTSGEPFASGFAGRNLLDYDRYYLPTDQYLMHPDEGNTLFVQFTDLFGFSTAVESYEYSKYYMNTVMQQTTAGVSLINGPLIQAMPGATPKAKLGTRIQQLLYTAGTALGGFATLPPPANNPQNDFGFPGVWPNFAPYKTFDPTNAPLQTIVHSCTTVTSIGYGGVGMFGDNTVPIYECDYNSLHLPNRTSAIVPVIGPGILGFTAWKAALWAIDFTGRIHDSNSNIVNAINPVDAPMVGVANNTVTAIDPPGPCPANQTSNCSAVGTYIGSTPLEGMWGLLMVDEMDNAAQWMLTSLTTSDGATLDGWGSIAAATSYDYTSPLRWYPTAISVTEDGSVPYPLVSSTAIQDATSVSEDLAALLRGEALFFGMTDARNTAVGQQIGCQIEFSGVIFPSDDGAPDGEPSPHDRSLAILRTAFIDLERIHEDPSTGLIADTATISGGVVTRSASVTTTSLVHVLLGLRTALMGLNATVSQYGAPDDNPAEDESGILNSVPIHPATGSTNFSSRIRQVFLQNAEFVRDVLTTADGTVANGATLQGGKATAIAGAATLDSQAAAIRAMVEGFELTGDATYVARGRAIAEKLDGAFYSQPARMYRETAGGPDQVHMTPERFAWIQSALRESYKVLYVEGDPVLDRTVLSDRIARTDKLFLNGWDDLNGNQHVDIDAGECLGVRMQQGEQALTGEVGTDSNGVAISSGPDRDSDCILELSHAKHAAVQPTEIFFHSP